MGKEITVEEYRRGARRLLGLLLASAVVQIVTITLVIVLVRGQ